MWLCAKCEGTDPAKVMKHVPSSCIQEHFWTCLSCTFYFKRCLWSGENHFYESSALLNYSFWKDSEDFLTVDCSRLVISIRSHERAADAFKTFNLFRTLTDVPTERILVYVAKTQLALPFLSLLKYVLWTHSEICALALALFICKSTREISSI